jgi:hypothetical protein
MESETLALEMPSMVDTDEPRRALVAGLSLATVAVWSFTLVVTAQSLVL